MEVIWSNKAKENYINNLNYWDERNKTPYYSDKIEKETNYLIQEISNPNCLYFGRYSKKLNLYVRSILSHRFQIFFSIDKEKEIIYIKHFRGSKQEPL